MSQPIFIPNGVAQYPFTTPFIGQRDLFAKLQTEIRNHLSAGDVPNIMVMKGPWGSGKSRLGFEVCAQLLGTSRGWVTEKDIAPVPLLPKEEANRYLPLFLRYVDVLDYDITPSNVLPICFLKAMLQITEVVSKTHSRERLQMDCRKHLKSVGVDLEELKRRIGQISSDDAAQVAREVSGWLANKVGRVLLVVDEVETAGELPPDELPADMEESDRKANRDEIDILAQGCKEIANENVTPGVDYLLLASDPSYSSFASGALQSARITTLTFQPVTFDQIDILREAYKTCGASFPEHLEEAAFFIANRNFRWYNWLMFRLHESHKRKPASRHWELLEREAKNVSGDAEIFNLDELETFLTGRATVDEKLRQIIFSMLPTPAASIDSTIRSAIDNANQRAISRLGGVKLLPFELSAELRSRNFSGSGNRFERGGVTIEVTRLLSAFQLFGSIGEKFFFYKDSKEFEQQVMLLYPEIDDSSICRDLHQIFLNHYSEQGATEAFGPSLELLSKLNRKWKTPKESAFLSNPDKNLELQKARETEVNFNPTEKRQHLARGMANLVFEERWKQKERVAREQIKLGTGILADVSDLSIAGTVQSTWKVSPFQVVPILVADADTATLINDLKIIRAKVGLAPLILLLLDRDRYEQLDQDDKAFHEGEVYPRELLVEIEVSSSSADFIVCSNFGHAQTIGFRFDDLSPGRWTHRSQSLRKKLQEEWDSRLRKVDASGWVIRPVYQKRDADKLILYVEAVVRGESMDSIRQEMPESEEAKKNYDEHRSHLEPIFDDHDQPVLTGSHLHILRRMRDAVDVSQASPILREVLYQGYLRVTAVEALKQNLEYLKARGIIRFEESTQKYKAVTPTVLKSFLDEGERTIREYKTQRDALKSFYEGTLNSFHMQDADIDPLLSQLEEHRKVLKNKYQGDLPSWSRELLEEYSAFCSECHKTLTQISDPSAERAYPDISVEIIEEAWPKLTSGTLALEGNVAHRVRFLTQYQKEYERKKDTVIKEAKRRQHEISSKLKSEYPAFPWKVIEDAIASMLDDLERTDTVAPFTMSSPDLSKGEQFPRFSLRQLITQSRLMEAYSRLVRYHENLLESSDGMWKRALALLSKWDSDVMPVANRALNRWDDLDKYLADAGSHRQFLEERDADRESIESAVSSVLPLKSGSYGLSAIEEALDTLQREAQKLEDAIKEERERLDKELIEDIPDLKGLRTLMKLADRARSRSISVTFESPESIAQDKTLSYKEKKGKIAGLARQIDQEGRNLVTRFSGASAEDWEIYKKVVSALYREKGGYEYDFETELPDGLVNEEQIIRMRDLGLLAAEKKWKIEP